MLPKISKTLKERLDVSYISNLLLNSYLLHFEVQSNMQLIATDPWVQIYLLPYYVVAKRKKKVD